MVTAPKIPRIRLPMLAPGEVAELTPEATIDGREFIGTDLTDVDVSDGAVTECRFESVTGIGTGWERMHLTTCVIERATLASIEAKAGSWRAVAVTGSRIGALDMHDGRLESVTFTSCKLGYTNLRHVTLKDVRFDRCQIDELDLLEAHANRVQFTDCQVGALVLHQAQLLDVDLTGADLGAITGVEYLRGAAVTSGQLVDLAAAFAEALGVEVCG